MSEENIGIRCHSEQMESDTIKDKYNKVSKTSAFC